MIQKRGTEISPDFSGTGAVFDPSLPNYITYLLTRPVLRKFKNRPLHADAFFSMC